MILKDIYGIWRHVHGDVVTDFAVRVFDVKTNKGRSRFGIHGKDENGNVIDYAWEGVIVGLNDNGDGTFTIEIEQIKFTEDKPKYQELKIYMLAGNVMMLELANGDMVEFEKIR
ncbi:MAG: hypothetical protein AB8B52_02375 [Winogradskyella sp.]|uniref:hypothetical protein n=1 Tax=Winogradskyella sp. TaxID=1883156 RepID=UPI00385C69A3